MNQYNCIDYGFACDPIWSGKHTNVRISRHQNMNKIVLETQPVRYISMAIKGPFHDYPIPCSTPSILNGDLIAQLFPMNEMTY